MPSPLPQLPSLFPARPSWAPEGMSADTITDIRKRPDQLRGYRSGRFNQINFTGSLAPQPPVGDTSGVVYAGGQPPDAGGYVAPQTIPGTASNWTVDNPNPNVPRPRPQPGGGAASDVVAQAPWFTQPWGAASQETDLPWWQRGLRR